MLSVFRHLMMRRDVIFKLNSNGKIHELVVELIFMNIHYTSMSISFISAYFG